jgi:hypothetical protein
MQSNSRVAIPSSKATQESILPFFACEKKTAESSEHLITKMDCGFHRNDTGSLADCGALCVCARRNDTIGGVKAQTQGVIPAKAGIPVVFAVAVAVAFEKNSGKQ